MSNSVWSAKSIEYARECELICDNYFNKLTGCTNWFSSVSKNSENSRIDWNFKTKSGISGKVELKNRFMNIDTYPTIMIECDKYDALVENIKENGIQSVYINFLNSPDNLWMLNIKKTMKIEFNKVWTRITVKKCGDSHTYYDWRYFIPKEMGNYYVYNNIKKKYEKRW